MVSTRREFLNDVGRGMLVASIGPALAMDLGLVSANAAEPAPALNFGSLDPLVALMQETPADKLMRLLVERLRTGTELRQLVAAGALANAKTFGGQDYVGFHTFMALAPAWEMSRQLPEERRPLPVLKVLHRNARTIQGHGGRPRDVLRPVESATLSDGSGNGEALREAMRKIDMAGAERTFAAISQKGLQEAYNDLQMLVQDDIDVHRVVLAWRAWAALDLTGKEQAHTLLRQSVRYCVDVEERRKRNNANYTPSIRQVLPKLLDQYKLAGRTLGDRKADDEWIEKLSQTIYGGNRDQASEAVAAAIAEGMSGESITEAMALAANRLVLCDRGRNEPNGTKAKFSCHGDSVGVHASDAANAWRNIARVANSRNAVASLIVGAYHTGGQSGGQHKQPYPHAEHLDAIQVKDADALLHETEAAIKAKNQALAAALVHRYSTLGLAPRPIFDLLLKFAISEDGALHAEKYYWTVNEEFAAARPAFRWRQLVALARVTASECGEPAPGYAETCQLLKV
jgi:hypothetical protein